MRKGRDDIVKHRDKSNRAALDKEEWKSELEDFVQEWMDKVV